MSKDSDKLYSMELHDTIGINDYTVLRVLGGWIYTAWDYAGDTDGTSSIFVLFNNEFQR